MRTPDRTPLNEPSPALRPIAPVHDRQDVTLGTDSASSTHPPPSPRIHALFRRHKSLPGTPLLAKAFASFLPPPEGTQRRPFNGNNPNSTSARSITAIIGLVQVLPPMIDGTALTLLYKEGNCITDGPHTCTYINASLPCCRYGTRNGHSPRGTSARERKDYFSPTREGGRPPIIPRASPALRR